VTETAQFHHSAKHLDRRLTVRDKFFRATARLEKIQTETVRQVIVGSAVYRSR
jgi:hypothetical protein